MTESPHVTPSRDNDQAGRQYWDSVWAVGQVPDAVNPKSKGFRNLYNRRMDALFHQIFDSVPTMNKTLLEVGCARSTWLPYLAREFGFKVSGLDYSELGCEQEKQVLSKAGVSGSIVCADLFTPPPALLGSFDVVVAFGVVEHFQDTAECLHALAAFLRPDGLLLTQVPNMTGVVGRLQKLMNPATYAIHMPLTREQLRTAHERAGLKVAHCDCFLSTGFGVVSLHGLDDNRFSTHLKWKLLSILRKTSVLVWALENTTVTLPPKRLFAPFIFSVARCRVETT